MIGSILAPKMCWSSTDYEALASVFVWSGCMHWRTLKEGVALPRAWAGRESVLQDQPGRRKMQNWLRWGCSSGSKIYN